MIIFDILNVFCLWRIEYYRKNPNAKPLPRNYHRDFQLEFSKSLLKKKIVEPELQNQPLRLLQQLQPKQKKGKRKSGTFGPLQRGPCYACNGAKANFRNDCIL